MRMVKDGGWDWLSPGAALLVVRTSVGLYKSKTINSLVAKAMHLYSRSAPETPYFSKIGLAFFISKGVYYGRSRGGKIKATGGIRAEFYSLSIRTTFGSLPR